MALLLVQPRLVRYLVRKQFSFSIQNIPILGAGAEGAASAVIRDTHIVLHADSASTTSVQ